MPATKLVSTAHTVLRVETTTCDMNLLTDIIDLSILFTTTSFVVNLLTTDTNEFRSTNNTNNHGMALAQMDSIAGLSPPLSSQRTVNTMAEIPQEIKEPH